MGTKLDFLVSIQMVVFGFQQHVFAFLCLDDEIGIVIDENGDAKSCISIFLFPTFPTVALATKHLAVFGSGAATIVPRRDVVGLHLIQLKMLVAMRADSQLIFVGRQLLRLAKCTNREEFLFARQDVRIDARLLGHVVVQYQLLNLLIHCLAVDDSVFKCFVERTPVNTFHDLFSFFGWLERTFYPCDDRLEKLPQGGGTRVVLMIGHVNFYVSIRDPGDGRLQIVLSDGGARQIVGRNLGGYAAGLTEVALGVAHPGSCIDGVAQFLFRQLLAGDVDGLEPLELLAVAAATDIDVEFVVQNLLLLVRLQVVEIAEQVSKVAIHILADADGALLPVDDLVGAVVAHGPVHHVERKSLCECVNDGIALFVLIYKLALIGWTYVQFAPEGAYAVLGIVLVALR